MRVLRLVALGLGISALNHAAIAVPAPPGWLQGQAAGAPFRFHLWGDEFVNWAVAEDGQTLLQDRDGVWRHAQATPEGGLRPGPQAYDPQRAAADSRGLRPTTDWLRREVAPLRARRDARRPVSRERVEGQWNLLLILIHYPDQQPVIPALDFDHMMNQTGWHDTGSFDDYYSALSYQRFSTVSVVTVWVEAAHEHDYYGYNTGWSRSQELVREAALAVEAQVDFSQFDNDGNGVVDGLLVVHSGLGAEEGDGSNIWSHRWALWGQELQLDGVTVSDYTIQPELQGGAQSAIGVYVHEFGHALGLPDLYDTDYSSSGVGSWCVMSGGSWGGSGSGGTAHVPVSMSAWCRQALGWSTVTTTATELVDYGLPAIHLSDEIVRLDLPDDPGQYFLAENRPLSAWDRHQAAGGLYIWHVDENMSGNTEDDHFLVDLEQADGRRDLNQGSGSDAGDIFPGAANNRLFNAQSLPASLPYGGGDSPVSIGGIGDPADTLRATFFQFFSHQDLSWEGWSLTQDDGGDLWPDPGEEINLSLRLANHGAEIDSLHLDLLMEQAGIQVLEGSVVMGPVPSGPDFDTPPFRLALAQDLPAGDYALTVRSVDGTGWEQLTPGLLQVGRRQVLLYLDGAGEALGSWYREPLEGLGHATELRVRDAGSPPPADLAVYPFVVWVTGEAAAPLSSSEISAFSAYLGGGGRLLLSGQHLLDGLTGAGRTLLGADPGPPWNSQLLLRGLSAGGLVADGEIVLLTGGGGAWNQQLPAGTLLPRAGSTALARWGAGDQVALLRRQDAAWGDGRLILAGCSLEAIHGAAGLLSRAELLERFLAWLEEGVLVGVEPAPAATRPAPLTLEARPNPFNPSTLLTLDLPAARQVELRVWNLAGQLVLRREMGLLPAGRRELRLDLAGRASGTYLVEARCPDGGRAVARLLLLR